MRTCPNCTQDVPDASATVCPNCGASLPPLPVVGSAVPELDRLMTPYRWLDLTLGVLTLLGSVLLFGIGILVAVVVYFAVRKTYPVYARGIGFGVAFLGILLLGAFALCVGLFTLGNLGH